MQRFYDAQNTYISVPVIFFRPVPSGLATHTYEWSSLWTVCQCLTIAFHLSAVSYKHSFTQVALQQLLSVFLFLSPRHHLLSQGTTCKAWPLVNSVAFPYFSLFSKPVVLFSSSKCLCSSFLSLCIASIAIQTTLQCWSLNPHLKRKFLGTVGRLNAWLHYQWGGGGFRIHNINFWEWSDGRMHEHYHSVGLAQARPN